MSNPRKRRQHQGCIGHPEHGFGYIRDPAGHRYTGFQHHPGVLLGANMLPSETHNVDLASPVTDQGRTGSCTGQGTSCFVTTSFANLGIPLVSPLSPRVTYQLGRAVDRESPAFPLEDRGAAPNSVVRALGLWGCVLEHETHDVCSGDSAVKYLEDHVNDEPKLGEIIKAGRRRLIGFNSIDDADPAKVLHFCQSLASGHALGVAVDAGNDMFQGFNGDGVLDYCGSDPDHWVAIIDYRTTSNGEVQFLLQNSWGVDLWAPTGRAWVTSNFVVKGCFNTLVANMGG